MSSEVTAPVVAEWLHITEATLRDWHKTGNGPPARTGPDGRLRYRVTDLERWLNSDGSETQYLGR